MFVRSFFALILMGTLAIGCASKKPKNSQEKSTESLSNNGTNAGLTLELNGDSDQNTAGGLESVFFAYDSSSISSETQENLSQNAEYLKANTNVDIQIEGHCDERGSRQYNLALGERRAQAVKDYLITMGVESRRISTISYGSERPKAEGHDESAWSQNRRANFVITAK